MKIQKNEVSIYDEGDYKMARHIRKQIDLIEKLIEKGFAEGTIEDYFSKKSLEITKILP